MTTVVLSFGLDEALEKLGIKEVNQGTSTGSDSFGSEDLIESFSPVDGLSIGKVTTTTREEYEQVIQVAMDAFEFWRKVPAPQRGEIVRQFGEKLRELKEPLGKLVSYEMGKS
ncbi:MAG: aldehyde dehydrogenase family protein, partial [Bacteroidota bacterium]